MKKGCLPSEKCRGRKRKRVRGRETEIETERERERDRHRNRERKGERKGWLDVEELILVTVLLLPLVNYSTICSYWAFNSDWFTCDAVC